MRRWTLLLCFLAACSSDSGNTGAPSNATTNDQDASQTDVRVDSGPPTLGERPGGAWFGGDLHVHATGASNDTGGDSFPARIKEVALERGLSWVVLTDHSNSTGSDPTTRDEDPALFNMGPEFPYWDEVAQLSESSFLFVDGNEISPVDEGEIAPTGHVGCAPRDLQTFDTEYVFTDRPRGSVTGGDVLEQAKEAGCFATVNHPYALAAWTAWDWTSTDYDALEVYNGTAAWDQGDFDGLKAWACDVSLGRTVTAVGGSDNHRIEIAPPGDLTNPPLAYPVTWVYIDELTWPNVMDALTRGRVSVTDDGVPLEFDVFGGDGEWLAMPGDSVAAESARWARIRGAVQGADGPRVVRLYKIVANACDDPREPGARTPPTPNWEVVWEAQFEDGETIDEQFEFTATAGDAFFVYKGPESDRGVAKAGVGFTNAIRFTP